MNRTAADACVVVGMIRTANCLQFLYESLRSKLSQFRLPSASYEPGCCFFSGNKTLLFNKELKELMELKEVLRWYNVS